MPVFVEIVTRLSNTVSFVIDMSAMNAMRSIGAAMILTMESLTSIMENVPLVKGMSVVSFLLAKDQARAR